MKQPKKTERVLINPADCGHFGYVLKNGVFVCMSCGQPDPNNIKPNSPDQERQAARGG